jgi:hypothetical protein
MKQRVRLFIEIDLDDPTTTNHRTVAEEIKAAVRLRLNDIKATDARVTAFELIYIPPLLK